MNDRKENDKNKMKKVVDGEPFVIYGAQIVAVSVYTVLKSIYHVIPRCFLVSHRENNPKNIDGIDVITFQDYLQENTGNELMLVAVPAYYADEIERVILQRKISNYVVLNNDMENRLMREYYRKIRPEQVTAANDTEKGSIEGLIVCKARSSKDKALSTRIKEDPHIVEIQAGAALTDMHIADLADDSGENISNKNQNYCELTVTYWVWKNLHSEYKGICHYRRIWRLQEIRELKDYDAYILYPNIYYPSADVHHKRYISANLWGIFRKFLKEYRKELFAEFMNFMQQPYLSNFNMVIARNKVFDEYAEWLFDILFSFEKYLQENETDPPLRYMGYFAENLTPYYFLSYRTDIRTGFIGKDTLV